VTFLGSLPSDAPGRQVRRIVALEESKGPAAVPSAAILTSARWFDS